MFNKMSDIPINRLGFTHITAANCIENPAAVIIFVHGLRGNPRRTWSNRTSWRKKILNQFSQPVESSPEFCWPRDALPGKLPNVEIFLYGYNADLMEPCNEDSQVSITKLSERLLHGLVHELENLKKKDIPILFVAHSLGGILVKDVLFQSRNNVKDIYRSIHRNTRGVMFMGTPHRGSDAARVGLFLLKVVMAGFQKPNKRVLTALARGSELLERIDKEFRNLLSLENSDLDVYCFLEDRPVISIPGFKDRIVSPESAKIGHPRETCITLDADHIGMVAFCGPNDPNYLQVLNALKIFIDKIVKDSSRMALPSCIATDDRVGQRLLDFPYRRNLQFYGRDKVLNHLHNSLTPQLFPGGQRSCVVHGMGGLGKTQIAIEYAYRSQDKGSYELIYWINAENRSALDISIMKLSNVLGLKVQGTSAAMQLEEVRKYLEKPGKRWLLIYDNVELWSDVEPYIPQSKDGAILITSRNDQLFSKVGQNIRLKPFTPAEGSECILKLLSSETKYNVRDAMEISNQLGGHALALGYAAGFISYNKLTLAEFLKILGDRACLAHIFAMEPPKFSTINQYERSLEAVWDVALRGLPPDHLKLLQILSMLNPDGTPEDLFYPLYVGTETEFGSLGTPYTFKILEFGTLIGDLATRHLIIRETIGEKAQLLIHRSLQKGILHSLDKDPRLFQHIFHLAFTLIRKVYPKQSPSHDPQNELWQTQELYQTHVLSLHAMYQSSKLRLQSCAGLEFAELLSDAAYYFLEKGTYLQATTLTDTAEEICEACPPGSYRLKANVYAFGAAFRWGIGITRREEVLRRFLTSLLLLQTHINEIDSDRATSDKTSEEITRLLCLYAIRWTDVSIILADSGFIEESILCVDLGIAIKERLGDYVGVLRANRHKAIALAWLGKVKEAVSMVPEKSKIPLELLDPGYASNYERCRFVWANVLLMSEEPQNLKKAHDILQENLNSRRELFGETGYYTLNSHYLLGTTLLKMKRPKEAILHFNILLEDSARDWPEESKCLAMHQLSKAFAAIGEFHTADTISDQAQKIKMGFCKQYKLATNGISDDDEIYEFIAPYEMGRVTSLKKFQTSGKVPKLMKVCRDMLKRLNAYKGKGLMEPSKCLKLCKSQELDINYGSIPGIDLQSRVEELIGSNLNTSESIPSSFSLSPYYYYIMFLLLSIISILIMINLNHLN